MTYDGADVRARRERLGVSRQALADLAAVKLRALEHLEAGHNIDGHSRSADALLATLAELEAMPRLPSGLQGDHPRTWWTI